MEIPSRRLTGMSFTQLKHHIARQRRSRKDRERYLREILLDVFQNLLVRLFLLMEIIARKRQDGEPPVSVFLVKIGQLHVVGLGQSSFARDIDNECDGSSVFHQLLGDSVNICDGGTIDGVGWKEMVLLREESLGVDVFLALLWMVVFDLMLDILNGGNFTIGEFEQCQCVRLDRFRHVNERGQCDEAAHCRDANGRFGRRATFALV